MTLSRPHLLIVGNGMACNRLLMQLQSLAPDNFRITVIGQENSAAYNRILLTPWLNGEISTDELRLQDADWYTRHHITMHLGDAAVTFDTNTKTLICQSGKQFTWDLLVIATGSQALVPPVPGHQLEGVMCLRTLDDATTLIQRCKRTHSNKTGIAVVGGGVLGLEAACALNAMGFPVTVIHRDAWLMNRQLDKDAGDQLAEAIRLRGIKVFTGVNCTRFLAGKNNPSSLRGIELVTLDTTVNDMPPLELSFSTAVLAIGIKPEISLAKAAGLHCERAIVVDPWLRTSIENVFALGECCQIHQEMFGLVAPVYQQADVLADVLARGRWLRPEPSEKKYQTATLATRLKVANLDVFAVGVIPTDNTDAELTHSVIWQDSAQGHYRRLWLQDNKLAAAVALGDIDGLSEYAGVIDTQQTVKNPVSLLLGGDMIA